MWSSLWIKNWQGKSKYSEKTCPSSTLSTINPTWPDLTSNPGRRGGKPATNRLSYGTAHLMTACSSDCWNEAPISSQKMENSRVFNTLFLINSTPRTTVVITSINFALIPPDANISLWIVHHKKS
jgi:hypothetical protein